MKYFDHIAETSGERLFQLIMRELYGNNAVMSLQSLPMLSFGARSEYFSDLFIGISCFNILARMIKKAERIRSIDDPNLHQPEMIRYMQASLGIPRRSESDAIQRIASMALVAAADSKKKISDAVKDAVCGGRTELNCYICGAIVLRKTEDPDSKAEFEHLWPASFGGNSIAENLLPACPACNRAKGHMLLWQTGHVSSFVLKPQPSEEELKSISRREKIAKHTMNIYDRACRDRTSVKIAALAVGPVNMSQISQHDVEDSVDFFNFNFY
ncbi:HNH endonuclease [Burkholderia contaminans]|uniref:HNH endonuclease n=2 Tax=Burkholderia contaminans TaxID=488447 RepID=UPI000ACDD4E7|nr:HNH endonuclease [Burkholderia contaminans]MEB4633718.1 hypothetical protein [Burkholderia contaminans]MEB4638563.1 hypothetical protein [Burkholderia contaminans]MEB4657623.1 hypothetical protein [Burkholderia contaminans]MEB4665575.1 hypothetical protein [Burkholderia contaminans]MEB4671719.1 hypothetical protein [Burkholderia contaminans]